MYSVSPASREALEELVATLRYVCVLEHPSSMCVCVDVAGTGVYPHVCMCVFIYVCVDHVCVCVFIYVCVDHVCVS